MLGNKYMTLYTHKYSQTRFWQKVWLDLFGQL